MQIKDFIATPWIIDKADGLCYWDEQGKRYFDAIGGIFAAVLGHRRPRVMDAVSKQMDEITFAPPLHGIRRSFYDLAEGFAIPALVPLLRFTRLSVTALAMIKMPPAQNRQVAGSERKMIPKMAA